MTWGQHQRLAWHNVCSTSHEVQICIAASPAWHPLSYHTTTTQLLRPQNQPGKRWCLAAGSSWDDPAVNASGSNCAHFPGTLGWSLFWAEDWSALWAMVRSECRCRSNAKPRRAGQKSSKSSHVFAKLLHWPVLVKKEELWRLPEMPPPVPVTEQIVQEIKSLYPAGSRATGTSVSSNFSPVLL